MMIKQQTYRRGQKLLLFTLALVLCTITLFAQKKANLLWTGPGTPAKDRRHAFPPHGFVAQATSTRPASVDAGEAVVL